MRVSQILKYWDLGFLVSDFIFDDSNSFYVIVIYELIKYHLLTCISVLHMSSFDWTPHKKLDTSTYLEAKMGDGGEVQKNQNGGARMSDQKVYRGTKSVIKH